MTEFDPFKRPAFTPGKLPDLPTAKTEVKEDVKEDVKTEVKEDIKFKKPETLATESREQPEIQRQFDSKKYQPLEFIRKVLEDYNNTESDIPVTHDYWKVKNNL